jgi:hypothetical protein
MNDKRDAREPASVSDGNVNGIVKCPICKGLHPVKLDRNGNPYVALSCVGAGSNLFPRTPFGKESFARWKKAASDDAVAVPLPVPAPGENALEPIVPSESVDATLSPDAIETAMNKFLERHGTRRT